MYHPTAASIITEYAQQLHKQQDDARTDSQREIDRIIRHLGLKLLPVPVITRIQRTNNDEQSVVRYIIRLCQLCALVIVITSQNLQHHHQSSNTYKYTACKRFYGNLLMQKSKRQNQRNYNAQFIDRHYFGHIANLQCTVIAKP